jgi:hypothetical protein
MVIAMATQTSNLGIMAPRSERHSARGAYSHCGEQCFILRMPEGTNRQPLFLDALHLGSSSRPELGARNLVILSMNEFFGF